MVEWEPRHKGDAVATTEDQMDNEKCIGQNHTTRKPGRLTKKEKQRRVGKLDEITEI